MSVSLFSVADADASADPFLVETVAVAAKPDVASEVADDTAKPEPGDEAGANETDVDNTAAGAVGAGDEASTDEVDASYVNEPDDSWSVGWPPNEHVVAPIEHIHRVFFPEPLAVSLPVHHAIARDIADNAESWPPDSQAWTESAWQPDPHSAGEDWSEGW